MNSFVRRILCVLFSLPACLTAWAGDAQALQLLDSRGEVDAWSAVTMLADPTGTWQWADVVQHGHEFTAPGGPMSNLGVRRDVVWLRVPLAVPANESGRWLLDVDYPSLDRIDVFQVTDTRLQRSIRLGDNQPYAARPLAARTHVAPLVLQPGRQHELLLRVQTTSSMILPIKLMQAERYHEREARVQLAQGLMTGIGLCLLLYSIAQWLSLRDATFAYYGVATAGTSVFFFAYYGLGPQHLWGGSEWLTANMAPLSVLIGLVGGLLFLDRTLLVAELNRRLSRAMRFTALVSGVAALAFSAGVLDYRLAHLCGTVLGPLPIVLGLPAAVARVRAGDRASVYVVAGWGLYGVGIIVMAALLRGLVDSNDWTQHAFQAGSMLEMVMWQRVLAVRQEQLRHLAERADREREAMRSLAHTDALTGLPNRRGLQLELAQALPRAQASRLLALYLLDLDGFKAINDRLGHDAGDELLKAVAGRVRAQLRNRDVVARHGGDEFVVLVGDLSCDADAKAIGQKLLDAFDTPFDLRGQRCKLGLTIGYAVAPLDGFDDASLLKRADAAMYAGKQAGKHTLRRGQTSVGLVTV
jgi:diguanylate cyclase